VLYPGDSRLYQSDSGLYSNDSRLYCGQSEALLNTRTQQSLHSAQSLPLGAPDSFRMRYMSCAVRQNGLPTARRPPGCSVCKNFSRVHPEYFQIFVYRSTSLCNRYNGCRMADWLLFSPHQLHSMVIRCHTVPSVHGHSIRHTVPPVHAVRFTAWPLDTTHSTTGTCSAVHSMATRYDTQYHRYMQCGSQHEHSTWHTVPPVHAVRFTAW